MCRETYATVSEIFGLLSNPPRRCVLYRLLQREETTVEELSRQVLTIDDTESVGGATTDDREQVTIALIHSHLPRLADDDLLTYDADSGKVSRGESFEAIRPALESVRSLEREEFTIETRLNAVALGDGSG